MTLGLTTDYLELRVFCLNKTNVFKLASAILGFFLLLAWPSLSFAAISFSISNPRYDGDEVVIDISLSGLTSASCPNTNCYLQAAFTYSTSNPRYFGFTKNVSGSWYEYVSSPDPSYIQSTFFSFQPVDGNWSGEVRVKPNVEDKDYKGSGAYTIKAWRYTGNSDSSSGASENTVSIEITAATPTPSPTPTSTPSPTPTPTKVPSPTPVSNKTSSSPNLAITQTPTPLPAKKPIQNNLPEKTEETTSSSMVLGVTDVTPASTSTGIQEKVNSDPNTSNIKQYFAISFAGTGVIFIIASAFLFWRGRWSGTMVEDNEDT